MRSRLIVASPTAENSADLPAGRVTTTWTDGLFGPTSSVQLPIIWTTSPQLVWASGTAYRRQPASAVHGGELVHRPPSAAAARPRIALMEATFTFSSRRVTRLWTAVPRSRPSIPASGARPRPNGGTPGARSGGGSGSEDRRVGGQAESRGDFPTGGQGAHMDRVTGGGPVRTTAQMGSR